MTDTPAGFLAIIRTSPHGRAVTFVKGPFESVRAAEVCATAHIEESSGSGGCGTFDIIASLVTSEHVHDRMVCRDGNKCGWVRIKLAKRSERA